MKKNKNYLPTFKFFVVSRFFFFVVCMAMITPFCYLYAQSTDHDEAWYRDRWCIKPYDTEVRVETFNRNSPRCDCVTKQYAVEIDFAHKWYNAVGQSLYYAAKLDKMAAILIVAKDLDKDKKHIKRLFETIDYYDLPITVWVVDIYGSYVDWR